MKHSHTDPTQIPAWFAGRIPAGWFTAAPQVTSDSDEVLVVGPLAEPTLEAGAAEDAQIAAARARIQGFREDTREQRMRIAQEAERQFGRRVSWGATCGTERHLFTTASLPVMTRLGLEDRAVLDTLVEAGVARSRSHALAWCVRLVGQHQGAWLTELKDALGQVEKVRATGPA
ncbi:MAG: hypothetical protein ACYDAY_09105 [Candidatus Dormibacteria bacterium]